MTGPLPSRTAVYDNAAEFSSSIPTFAHYLRLEGYRTCLCGKMHFVGPDQLHGFEERLTTDVYPGDFGWTPDWSKPDERIDWWYHNMSSVTQAGVADITNPLEYDDEVAFHGRRRLRLRALRRERRSAVRLVQPSARSVCARASATGTSTTTTRSTSRASRAARGARPACAASLGGVRDGRSRSRRTTSAARHGYYASLSYVDEPRGVALAAFEPAGSHDDTVVILTSDHGDFLGEHGLFYKMSFREHAAPCTADRRIHGASPGRVREPVSLVDVRPTFSTLAGRALRELAPRVDGRSLVPLLEGASKPEADRRWRVPGGEVLSRRWS